jgi:hypothetical protein
MRMEVGLRKDGVARGVGLLFSWTAVHKLTTTHCQACRLPSRRGPGDEEHTAKSL